MRAFNISRAMAWLFLPPVRPAKLPVLTALVVVIISCADQAMLPPPIPPALSNVEIGVSYSPLQARKLLLDPTSAFHQVVAMRFALIRLSAYWNQIQVRADCEAKTSCYDFRELDEEMGYARDHHQQVMLTVGVKGIGWPEYYIPDFLLHPLPPDGKSVDTNQDIADGAIAFIKAVVQRYRGYQDLVAWQVENEPLDQNSGPHSWLISPSFLAEEVGVVKGADSRPVSVNAFSHHFLDLRNLRGGLDQEQASLKALGRGDILGIDVYKTPDTKILGHPFGGLLPNWSDQVGRWQLVAASQGKEAWISEVQAEPWNTVPFKPTETVDEIKQLTDHGFDHILLWGVEYWLAQDAAGHSQWLDTIRAIQTYVNQPKLFVAKANAAATS